MFLLPFIFQDAFNTDSDDNSDMNFIPRLMVELNFNLLLFFSREVPSDDIPKHKDNFIHLMNYIEDLSEKHSFLKECFSLPTHMILHLFEKWVDKPTNSFHRVPLVMHGNFNEIHKMDKIIFVLRNQLWCW